MFPAGTLPDETSPLSFTVRELEILRHLLWMTPEMEDRELDAKAMIAMRKMGAHFSFES